jgi:cytochrome c oxidase subunit 2
MSRFVRTWTPGAMRRMAPFAALAVFAATLGGCNLPTFGGFRGATSQGQTEFKLWSWMTITGLVVAVFVWALILWAVIAYRRRRPDEMPKQFHSNHVLEIIYTVVPLIIVGVIFFYTVVAENKIDALAPNPAVTIRVTGFQWGWSFQYLNSAGKQIALVETAQARPPVLAGNPTSTEYPQFVLPVGETTRIILVSNDVVHTFYVPAFNFGRYALPGVTNRFDFTPVKMGVYPGHCAQYCGLYHSEMLFSVKVTTPAAFHAWLTTVSTTAAA